MAPLDGTKPETKTDALPVAAPVAAADESIDQKLGLGQIEGEENGLKKQDLVKNYFKNLPLEQQTALFNRKALGQKKVAEDLAKLQQHVASFKQRDVLAKDIALSIIKKAQELSMESDVRSKDASGEAGDYIEDFLKESKTKKIEFDETVMNNCLDRLRMAIRSVPVEVRIKLRDDYAAAFITTYVGAIAKASPKIFGKFEDIAEAHKILDASSVVNFVTWLKITQGKTFENVPKDDPEVFAVYSPIETEAIVDVTKRLKSIKDKITTLPAAQQEAFTQRIQEKKFEEMLANNKAKKAAEELVPIENDVKKAAEEAAAKKLEEDKIAKAAEEAKKQETEETKTPEKSQLQDQLVLSDPKLKQIVQDFAKKNAVIAGFILSMFFTEETLDALDIKGPRDLTGFFTQNGLPGLATLAEPKAKALLKDKFGINTGDELKVLGDMTVETFLKGKPDAFKDEKKYKTFVEALTKNGATSGTQKKVFEYILLHVEGWKT